MLLKIESVRDELLGEARCFQGWVAKTGSQVSGYAKYSTIQYFPATFQQGLTTGWFTRVHESETKKDVDRFFPLSDRATIKEINGRVLLLGAEGYELLAVRLNTFRITFHRDLDGPRPFLYVEKGDH